MAIALDISSGQIDVGDTKILNVTPVDADGAVVVLTALSVVFTPATGVATTKTLGDFTLVAGVYSVSFTFASAGRWNITITATDGAGQVEVEQGCIRVK